MPHRLTYGIVRDATRRVIHVVRVQDEILDIPDIANIAARMRERLASRGETLADVVVIQGVAKETLRLFAEGYSVGRVRAALFNAAPKLVAATTGLRNRSPGWRSDIFARRGAT